MKYVSALIAPLLLAGCDTGPRSVEAELDADFAKGELLLSCKASSSGTCHAIFLSDGEKLDAQAPAGGSSSVSAVGEGTLYCVDAVAPNPARCRPQPLVAGKQIVRKALIKG